MTITATLRVVLQGTNTPSTARIKEAAGRLEQLGFRIVGQGQFSVIVEAEGALFTECLGGPAPSPKKLLARDLVPRAVVLQGLIDRLEIAPPVQYLDQ